MKGLCFFSLHFDDFLWHAAHWCVSGVATKMRILAPAWSSIRNKKYKDGSSHSPIWDPIYIFFLHGGEGLKYKLTLPPEQAIWKNLMGSLLERISFTLKEREIIFLLL